MLIPTLGPYPRNTRNSPMPRSYLLDLLHHDLDQGLDHGLDSGFVSRSEVDSVSVGDAEGLAGRPLLRGQVEGHGDGVLLAGVLPVPHDPTQHEDQAPVAVVAGVEADLLPHGEHSRLGLGVPNEESVKHGTSSCESGPPVREGTTRPPPAPGPLARRPPPPPPLQRDTRGGRRARRFLRGSGEVADSFLASDIFPCVGFY